MDEHFYAATAGLVLAAVTVILTTLRRALQTFSPSRLEQICRSRKKPERLSMTVQSHDAWAASVAVWQLVGVVGTVLCLSHAFESWQTASVIVRQFVTGLTCLLVLWIAVWLVPVIAAQLGGEMLIYHMFAFIRIVHAVTRPVTRVYLTIERAARRLAGHPDKDDPAANLEEEIRTVVSEGEREGAIEEDAREMIESVIEFQNRQTSEIMTPRTEMAVMKATTTLAEAVEFAVAHGHSRIPAIGETRDDIVGIVYVKDLLARVRAGGLDKTLVTEVMRPAIFVPETKRIDELLEQFQRERIHMAIVLDEYGGTAGVVTIEDILEELVGEIDDEYDPEEPAEFARIDDHTAEIDARLRIDELNDEMRLRLPEDQDYDTLGGLIFGQIGHIPAQGDSIEIGNVRFTVLEVSERKIDRLRVEVLEKAKAE